MRQVSQVNFLFKQSGGYSRWRIFYQPGPPRLVTIPQGLQIMADIVFCWFSWISLTSLKGGATILARLFARAMVESVANPCSEGGREFWRCRVCCTCAVLSALCEKVWTYFLTFKASHWWKNVFSSTGNKICLFVYSRFPNMVPLFV